MLQRHVDVARDLRVLGEQLDEPVVHRFRVQVEDAHPGEAGHVGHRLDQVGELLPLVRGLPLDLQIAPVGDGVLRDEVDLAHALCDEPLHLAHHVGERSRALLAAELGDGAESAGAVAPLGDLHVGADLALTQRARIARADHPVGRVAHQHPLGAAGEDLLELEHVARAEEVVDLAHLLGQLARVALRQAPGDDQPLAHPVLLHLGHLEDGGDGLLLRLADEAAGVDHDHLGQGRIALHPVAAALGDAEHHLAVDPVLRAAEADEMDRRLHSHPATGATSRLSALGVPLHALVPVGPHPVLVP